MHLVLTGGGTAGHITPNIALIEELKAEYPDLKITYIGSKKPMDRDLLKDQPVTFKAITTGKLRRYFSLQNLIDMFKVPFGILQAYSILRSKPNLVFSKGGYVALPVVIAAKLRRIPIIIHESDAIPGLVTKISSRFATEIWTSYEGVMPGAKVVQLPIRKSLKEGKPSIKTDKKVLLVMGGSLGAEAINNFIEQNIEALTKDYYIVHIAGKGKLNLQDSENYQGHEYVKEELANLYASADLILSRAGASALSEFAALGKKVILVPLPTTKSRGEQLINAQSFAKNYSGVVLEEQHLNLENFKKSAQKVDQNNPETGGYEPVTDMFKKYF